jgi:hypothetical protein
MSKDLDTQVEIVQKGGFKMKKLVGNPMIIFPVIVPVPESLVLQKPCCQMITCMPNCRYKGNLFNKKLRIKRLIQNPSI